MNDLTLYCKHLGGINKIDDVCSYFATVQIKLGVLSFEVLV